jgi:hypothetical protein
MTPEEQLASPEEGIQEQGYLETAEDALTQGRDNLPDVKAGALPFARMESVAESAITKLAREKPASISKSVLRDMEAKPAFGQEQLEAIRRGAPEAPVRKGPGTVDLGEYWSKDGDLAAKQGEVNAALRKKVPLAEKINYAEPGEAMAAEPLWKQKMRIRKRVPQIE